MGLNNSWPLVSLPDVNPASIVDGDMFVWNAATAKFVRGTSAVLASDGADSNVATLVGNLVLNPFFDDALQDPWTTVAGYANQLWHPLYVAQRAMMTIDPTICYIGYASLRMSAAAGQHVLLVQYIPVSELTQYTMSAFVWTALTEAGTGAATYGADADKGAGVAWTWYTAAGAALTTGQTARKTANAGWEKISLTESSPATAAYLRLELDTGDLTAGYAWFDAVDVRLGASAPTYITTKRQITTTGSGPHVFSGTFMPERVALKKMTAKHVPLTIYIDDTVVADSNYSPGAFEVRSIGDSRLLSEIDNAGNIWLMNQKVLVFGNLQDVSALHIVQDGSGTYGQSVIQMTTSDGMSWKHRSGTPAFAQTDWLHLTNDAVAPDVEWRNSHDHVWYSGDGTGELLRIKGATGWVGLGVVTPLHPLHVAAGTFGGGHVSVGAIGQGGVILLRNGTDGAVTGGLMMRTATNISELGVVASGGNTAGVWVNDEGFVRITTNFSGTFTERLRVTAAGDVGIGTTAPATLLELAGSETLTEAVTDDYSAAITLDPAYVGDGIVTTVTLGDAGLGYTALDVLTVVQTGGASCTVRVDTVDGGDGHIDTFTLLTGGTGYEVANGLATTVAPAGGSGATINVTVLTARTVTRHNFIDVNNLALTKGVAVTDAALLRFDAAIGTHKAVDAASTKTTPTGVDAWIKINIAGTLLYMPAYLSKTA